MKSIYKIALLMAIIFSLASSCQEKKEALLSKEMVRFDKAYIPVLYYTLQGEMEQAKRASFFLDYKWKKFESKFHKLNKENEDWQESFRMTDAWLKDAFMAIDSSEQQDSYMFLDHVRYQLMELRKQQQLSYFLDNVWDFEVSVDMVVEVATDQMLCLLDYCEFEDLVNEVNYTWHQIEQSPLDATLFEMDKAQLENLTQQQNKLKIALTNFNQSVKEGDGEALEQASANLRLAYLDYLYCFGDFSSSQSYFAAM